MKGNQRCDDTRLPEVLVASPDEKQSWNLGSVGCTDDVRARRRVVWGSSPAWVIVVRIGGIIRRWTACGCTSLQVRGVLSQCLQSRRLNRHAEKGAQGARGSPYTRAPEARAAPLS